MEIVFVTALILVAVSLVTATIMLTVKLMLLIMEKIDNMKVYE